MSMMKGGMTLTTAERPRQWRWYRDVEVLTIALSLDLFARVIEREEINLNSSELIDQFGTFDRNLQYLGLSLLEEIKVPGIADDLYLESLTNLLIIHLLREYSAWVPTSDRGSERITASRMQQVIDYIRVRAACRRLIAFLRRLQ